MIKYSNYIYYYEYGATTCEVVKYLKCTRLQIISYDMQAALSPSPTEIKITGQN